LHALLIGTVPAFGCRDLSRCTSGNTGTAGAATASSDPATTTADERGERRTEVCQLRISSVEVPCHFGECFQRITFERRVVDRKAEVWNFRERHLRELTTADKCSELLLDPLDLVNRYR
jgi:hypothetical protein